MQNMRPHRGTERRDGRPGPRGSARAVGRALDILLEFLHEGPELGITDLSRRLCLPKPTIHRLVATLASEGFLARNPETAKYRLGIAVFRLGNLFLDQLDVRKAAVPVMQELVRLTGETVNLNIVRDRRRVCIEKVESTHDIRHFVELGRPLPLHGGASGRVLLAFMDDAEIKAVIAEGLQPLTPRTITDSGRLMRNLAEIRRRGYAASSDERVAGASAVSAPVRDGAGRVVASLTISGPTYRFTTERTRHYAGLVQQGAAEISGGLGYRGPAAGRDGKRVARASLTR